MKNNPIFHLFCSNKVNKETRDGLELQSSASQRPLQIDHLGTQKTSYSIQSTIHGAVGSVTSIFSGLRKWSSVSTRLAISASEAGDPALNDPDPMKPIVRKRMFKKLYEFEAET